MLYYVCAIFIENDLLFCCKSKTNSDLWSFPIGDKPHRIVYESMIESLKEEITSEFDIEFPLCRDYTNGAKCINAELCTSKSSSIELSLKRDVRWITKDEIDSLEWESLAKPIAEAIKCELQKQRFIITLDNKSTCFDGWNANYNEISQMVKVVWDKDCSLIEAKMTFEKFIRKEQKECEENNTKWRVIRLYGEDGKQIAQES